MYLERYAESTVELASSIEGRFAHVVIIPVMPKEEHRAPVLEASENVAAALRAQSFHGAPVRVETDSRDIGGGVKKWEWIKKGVPVRIEISEFSSKFLYADVEIQDGSGHVWMRIKG